MYVNEHVIQRNVLRREMRESNNTDNSISRFAITAAFVMTKFMIRLYVCIY
jgi:hypothetical protein